MRSTPGIVKYTPAVLKALCKQRKTTKKKVRHATLKRVEVELRNILETPSAPIHEADQLALTDLLDAVRLALGDE